MPCAGDPDDFRPKFGVEWDMIRSIRETSSRRKDVSVICPPSIFSALSLAQKCATGETELELERMLGFRYSPERLFENVKKEAVLFHNANSMWLRSDVCTVANPPVKHIYRAENTSQINEWVKSNTNNVISEIVPDGMPLDNTATCLVNAVCFKASWEEFEAVDDRRYYFVSDENNRIPPHQRQQQTHQQQQECQQQRPCQMMTRRFSQSSAYCYFDDDARFEAVRFRFNNKQTGNESNFLFATIIIANPGVPLSELLNVQVWNRANDKFFPCAGQLTMPKFNVDTDVVPLLHPIIHCGGVKRAFIQGRAQFGNLFPPPENNHPYISNVFHRVRLSVKESGASFAASTSIGCSDSCDGPIKQQHPQFNITVDRPFVFVISGQSEPLLIAAISDMKQQL